MLLNKLSKQKVCAHWVLILLMFGQNKIRVNSFSAVAKKTGKNILIHYDLEVKISSMQWETMGIPTLVSPGTQNSAGRGCFLFFGIPKVFC